MGSAVSRALHPTHRDQKYGDSDEDRPGEPHADVGLCSGALASMQMRNILELPERENCTGQRV